MWETFIAILGGLFKPIMDRFFPPETPADVRAEVAQADVKIMEAVAKAGADAPTDKAELIKRLKDHAIALALCSLISLASCTTIQGVGCPAPRQWTDAQQDEIAANFATLPDNSPLIAVGVEWSRLRSESKACLEAGK